MKSGHLNEAWKVVCGETDETVAFLAQQLGRGEKSEGSSPVSGGRDQGDDMNAWRTACRGSKAAANITWELALSEEEQYVRAIAAAHGVSLIDVEDLRKEFKKYDADNSNSINSEELSHLIASLHCGIRPSPGQLRSWFQKIDRDCSGAIDFEEFITWWCTEFREDYSRWCELTRKAAMSRPRS